MKNIVDLNSLAGGAVAERFNAELQKILANIADPNTDPKKARKLTMNLVFKTDENRELAGVSIETKSTIVPAKNIVTAIILDVDSDGEVTGAELKSGVKGQTYITDEGQVADDKGKVISFK